MSEVSSSPDDNFEKIVSGITPSWEKEDAIIVPSQCESCPRVMAILDYLDDLRNSAKYLATVAMSDKVIISTDGEAIDGDEVARRLYEAAGEKFNEWDEETKIAKEEIRTSTNKCKGPLVLEGSDGRRTVSVTTCGSSKMFGSAELGKEQIGEPVTIRRDQKRNED